jgi:hypothetical protein
VLPPAGAHRRESKVFRPKRFGQVVIASLGVFIGSLLADILFGDGIQEDDVYQAIMVATVAALIQTWLSKKR